MEMTVYEFFDNVWGGELGEIDINNYISKITDNYNVRKLRLLKNDIEYCFSCAKDEIDEEYTQQDVENALNELQKKYNEIPDYVYITIPLPVVPFNKDNAGKVIFKEKKIINKEQLLYPYEFFNVRRLIGLIDRLIELYDIPEKTNKPKQKTFTDLFKIPYNKEKKITELKTILKTSGYIDNNCKWVGITKEKTELATLYWLFQDKENILNPDKVTPQLRTFYKEFGLIVYTDKEPAEYCTIRNIKRHPGDNTETYKEFERLFFNWISKE